MNTFTNSKIVTTKKVHKCACCGREIPKKSIVEYTDGMFEGEWMSFYLCAFCKDNVSKFTDDFDNSISTDMFYEWFTDEYITGIFHDSKAVKNKTGGFDIVDEYDDTINCTIELRLSYRRDE